MNLMNIINLINEMINNFLFAVNTPTISDITSYTTTKIFFNIIAIVTLLLLAINAIFAPRNSYLAKLNPFECGFLSFLWQNRVQFSIAFFIFGLLYLLFDLEVLLVLPYFLSTYTNSILSLIVIIIFLIILVIGFIFELGQKALMIKSKQLSSWFNKKVEITNSVSIVHIKTMWLNNSPIILLVRISKKKFFSAKWVDNKTFSTSTFLMVDDRSDNDEPSNNDERTNIPNNFNNVPSDKNLPDLAESRARGEWDSSTIPTTISETTSTQGINEYNRQTAEYARKYHDDVEDLNKQQAQDNDLITTKSGRLVFDFDKSHIKKMAEEVETANNPQEVYDNLHDHINQTYVSVKESSLEDRHSDKAHLKHNLKHKYDDADTDEFQEELDEKNDKINEKWDQVDEGNLNRASILKGELRYNVDKSLELRGLDETFSDAVEQFEDELQNIDISENQSEASLTTYFPEDELQDDTLERVGEVSNVPSDEEGNEASDEMSYQELAEPVSNRSPVSYNDIFFYVTSDQDYSEFNIGVDDEFNQNSDHGINYNSNNDVDSNNDKDKVPSNNIKRNYSDSDSDSDTKTQNEPLKKKVKQDNDTKSEDELSDTQNSRDRRNSDWQDTSDILPDCEPYDFTGGEE